MWKAHRRQQDFNHDLEGNDVGGGGEDRFVKREDRTYDCHAREDGEGEPGACHGRNLREPSFQANDGHLMLSVAAESLCGEWVSRVGPNCRRVEGMDLTCGRVYRSGSGMKACHVG